MESFEAKHANLGAAPPISSILRKHLKKGMGKDGNEPRSAQERQKYIKEKIQIREKKKI